MKKRTYYIINIFSIFLLLFGAFIPTAVNAKALIASGNSAQDAIITDEKGNIINHDQPLEKWNHYQVTYHWEIANNQTIMPGDTISFTLPENVQTYVPLEFPIKFKDEVVGTFKIDQNSQVGILTFNDYIQKNDLTNIKGDLNITVTGKKFDKFTPNWQVNKAGWVDDTSKKPTWNIAMNPNNETWGNVTVTDTMSDNQSYIPGSAYIQYGHYDNNGDFIIESTDYNPDLEQNGQTLIFHVADVHSAFQIRYQTTAKSPEGTLKNTASVEAEHLDKIITSTAEIIYSGKGDIDGNQRPIDTSSSSNISNNTSNNKENSTQDCNKTSSTYHHCSRQSKSSTSVTNAQPVIESRSTKESESSSNILEASDVANSKENNSKEDNTASNTYEYHSATQSSTNVTDTKAMIEKHSTTSSSQSIDSSQNNNPIQNEWPFINEGHLTNAEKRQKAMNYPVFTKSKKQNSKSNISSKQNKLPQTGEKSSYILPLSGLLMILIAGLYWKYRRYQ